MEVLGAVAATGQLIGTGFAILDAIDQLRDFLKHAPDRCQGWRCQLDALSGTICDIRQNSQLQTYQVKRIIEDIAPKISTLTKLCAHYAPEPQPKSRLYKRLSKALSAKGIERRILQSFQSLEQDKTTLILSISTIHGPKGEEMASDQTRANGRSLCREATNHSEQKIHPKKDEEHSPIASKQKTMSARPGINFANIDINNSLLGVTQSVESGGPITFMGAKSLNGIGGVHDREVVLAALERYHAASSSVPSTQPSPGSHGHYGISSHRGHVGSSQTYRRR
ncbi:hypothetical protein F4821DRAFT_233150 [Hypoxylon rubiginosum]|uniref:Uncharacterized protein n=1 Tax=Hypoxylon rubiginosum TaxID=110542 RepID=A0ACC0D8D4_9PEZI|nr:hypothetical protein F4821DRAFT_233150 [Hypoxylon rubiginosum]